MSLTASCRYRVAWWICEYAPSEEECGWWQQLSSSLAFIIYILLLFVILCHTWCGIEWVLAEYGLQWQQRTQPRYMAGNNVARFECAGVYWPCCYLYWPFLFPWPYFDTLTLFPVNIYVSCVSQRVPKVCEVAYHGCISQANKACSLYAVVYPCCLWECENCLFLVFYLLLFCDIFLACASPLLSLYLEILVYRYIYRRIEFFLVLFYKYDC